LANRLRITPGDAHRRVAEAADLGERRALTGETAAAVVDRDRPAQRAGRIGAGHVRVIRDFFEHLPCWVDIATQEKVEAKLARLSTQHRPDQVTKLAHKLMDCLNPDGDFTDEDRARKRGVILGKQDEDGMSRISGYITPEARAGVEAVWAKWAARASAIPTTRQRVWTAPLRRGGGARHPQHPQRQHDALNAAFRALLPRELGQHNGLPATIIVTTTLKDLEAAAGKGLTGGARCCP